MPTFTVTPLEQQLGDLTRMLTKAANNFNEAKGAWIAANKQFLESKTILYAARLAVTDYLDKLGQPEKEKE